VDGAHVPGQNPLHLDDLGADFYTGNCHKWMMAPKGCAFLYVKPELQAMIQPLVVSWGWGEVCEHTQTNQMVSYLQYSGTQDPATWLSISATIDFMKTENWDQVRLDCKRMVDENRARFDAMLGQGSAYGFEEAVPNQMFCSVLPADADLDELRKALVAAKIEVPLTELNGKKMVRVSVQGYVTQDDIDRLYDLLKDFFEK
jgi:isopenicillin-N epimerase